MWIPQCCGSANLYNLGRKEIWLGGPLCKRKEGKKKEKRGQCNKNIKFSNEHNWNCYEMANGMGKNRFVGSFG